MNSKSIATVYAILAAALYAINVPLSKVLLNYVEPTMMAGKIAAQKKATGEKLFLKQNN